MVANYLSRINKHRDQERFSFEDHHHHIRPARDYACSFCRKEFRTAQALGGHMNVHRRDRAKLRLALSSSWVDSECHKRNPSCSSMPNPTFFSLSPLSDELLNYTHLSPLSSPCLTSSSSPSSASTSDDKIFPLLTSAQIPLLVSPQSRETKMEESTRRGFRIERLKDFSAEKDEQKTLKNNESNSTLGLGMGLLKHPKENLDLELRLGHL